MCRLPTLVKRKQKGKSVCARFARAIYDIMFKENIVMFANDYHVYCYVEWLFNFGFISYDAWSSGGAVNNNRT